MMEKSFVKWAPVYNSIVTPDATYDRIKGGLLRVNIEKIPFKIFADEFDVHFLSNHAT